MIKGMWILVPYLYLVQKILKVSVFLQQFFLLIINVAWIKWINYVIHYCFAAIISEKILVIFELNNIFYQSGDGDASQKEYIEKMGRAADCTIEKKSFWFCPHAKTFLDMCFKKESLDIAIWTTSLKQNTTRVLKKLVSETLQAKFMFTWTASDCKQQKGKNAIDNSTQVIYKKHLKKVWRMYSQYNATNTILVDCLMRQRKKIPKKMWLLPFRLMERMRINGWSLICGAYWINSTRHPMFEIFWRIFNDF